MDFEALLISGAVRIKTHKHSDERGYFLRTFDARRFREAGLHFDWLQENQSWNPLKHTLRGLHFQRGSAAETKLIRVVRGEILDVLVDLRLSSPTYGRWVSVRLSEENGEQLLVPKGCAHGFCTLQPNTLVCYKVDAAYAPKQEGGVLWSDPDLGIDWPCADPLLSSRDQAHPRFIHTSPIAVEEVK